MAVFVDLEVEVAADGTGVAGFAHRSDSLAGPDSVATSDGGWVGQVGVKVAASLALAVDQEVVAVEDRVVATAQNAAGCNGNQRSAAGGDDVEAFVDPAAAARSAEFTDVAARPVRSLDREGVVEEGSAPAWLGGRCRCRRNGSREQD